MKVCIIALLLFAFLMLILGPFQFIFALIKVLAIVGLVTIAIVLFTVSMYK